MDQTIKDSDQAEYNTKLMLWCSVNELSAIKSAVLTTLDSAMGQFN